MPGKRVTFVPTSEKQHGASVYDVLFNGLVVGSLSLERHGAIGNARHAGHTPIRYTWKFEPGLQGEEDLGQACERLGIEWVLCCDRNFREIKQYLSAMLGRVKDSPMLVECRRMLEAARVQATVERASDAEHEAVESREIVSIDDDTVYIAKNEHGKMGMRYLVYSYATSPGTHEVPPETFEVEHLSSAVLSLAFRAAMHVIIDSRVNELGDRDADRAEAEFGQEMGRA